MGLVAREQQTAVVEDVAADPQTLPLAGAEGLETILATPLKAQGRLLGVMAVATRAKRSYSADDIYFVSSAGAQLASAIEHALLFREQIDRVERERRLLEAVETVNRSLGTHTVSMTVVTEAARLMNTGKAALLVLKGDSLVAEDVHNLSAEFRRIFVLPLDESVSGRAIRDGAPVAVDDIEREPLADAAIAATGGYRAFLTAPLQSYKGTYGALSVFYDRPHRFSDDDKTILATFASQATVALENQRLIREKDVLARTDGLTGVFNRSYLELALDQTMRSVHRNGGLVSLLFIDVDDLKTVNDQRGHQAGDRVLRDLARPARRQLPRDRHRGALRRRRVRRAHARHRRARRPPGPCQDREGHRAPQRRDARRHPRCAPAWVCRPRAGRTPRSCSSRPTAACTR